MSRQIKIKVRPNETMRFPGQCVHCSRPAAESMELVRRNGRTIRKVNVPLCDQCAGQLRRESGEEERMRKLGRLVIVVAAVLVAVILLLVLPGAIPFWLRMILVLIGTAAAIVAVRWLFRGITARAALPEKKAIRESARLTSFSWRSATFVFSSESFAERFVDLNEPLLMEM